LRLIDYCITQLKAQGPSRTCNESKEEVRVHLEEGLVRGKLPRAVNRRELHKESGPLRAVHLSRHKWPGGTTIHHTNAPFRDPLGLSQVYEPHTLVHPESTRTRVPDRTGLIVQRG